MKYAVVKSHRSEYPHPISFKKGDPLAIREKYEGPEGWSDWYFCTTPGHTGGWVPAQAIERLGDGTGRASEDYIARELNVDEGDLLFGSRLLNGWVWCRRPSGTESGWVPLENLLPVQDRP